MITAANPEGLDNVVYKRYLNSPTIGEIYNATFVNDVVLTEEEEKELSDGYDKATVEGNETISIYKAIFDKANREQDFNNIVGNESFISTVIEWVKKFFVGIFNMIKRVLGAANKENTDELMKELKDVEFRGIRDLKGSLEFKYTDSRFHYITSKLNQPPKDLKWLRDSTEDIRRLISSDKTKKINNDLNSSLQDVKNGKSPKKLKSDSSHSDARRFLNYNTSVGSKNNFIYSTAKEGISVNATTTPIEINASDISDLMSFKKTVLELGDFLNDQTKAVEVTLKTFHDLEKKYIEEVKKYENDREKVRELQDTLNLLADNINFWRNWHNSYINGFLKTVFNISMNFLSAMRKFSNELEKKQDA